MDNTAIENYSINAVKDRIHMSDYLTPFIPDNDKEPSWDGHIYIYSDTSKKKNKLSGRIPVQVKGTVNCDFSKQMITFPMDVSHLRNYLKDGGAMLFVVYVRKLIEEMKASVQTEIYYKELTPIKLMHIFAGMKEGQDSISVSLKVFPSDPVQMATVLLNCFENCKKQASFAGKALPTIEELEQKGIVEGVTVPVYGYDIESDYISAFLKNETYLYAQVTGFPTEIPIDCIMDYKVVQTKFNKPISVNRNIYYNSYLVNRALDKNTIIIGNSLYMVLSVGSTTCKIQYKSSSSLRTFVQDHKFMIDCIENSGFVINGCTVPISFESVDFNVKEQRQKLVYFEKVARVLDVLGCADDLDMSQLTQEDYRNLNQLIIAFIENKPVTNLRTDLQQILTLAVGKLRFVLSFSQHEDDATKYTIRDFFCEEYRVSIQGDEDEYLLVPKYVIFHADDFCYVSNMRFELLLPEFKKYDASPYIIELANNMLLDLILAYDRASSNRKEKIYNTAYEFAEWILALSDSYLDKRIAIINKFQLIRRTRQIKAEEKSQLYAIIEGDKTRGEILVGAYLLLDEQEQARRHFSLLDAETQENFRKFPIYHFWQE